MKAVGTTLEGDSFAFSLFPTTQFFGQACRQVNIGQTSIGLAIRTNLALVDGFGDRQRIDIVEGAPARAIYHFHPCESAASEIAGM